MHSTLKWLDGLFAPVSVSRTVDELRGYEGASTARYFQAWAAFLPAEFPFERRSTRPPLNPVNACISFGSTLLYHEAVAFLHSHGLDPALGTLHSTEDGRWSLALDLMEEFRPIIVDSVVLTLLNNGMLTPKDFITELGAYRLKNEPRKVFLTRFEERLNEEVTHPVFGYKVKYRRCIELQARLIAKYLTGEIEEYPPFTSR